MSADRVRAVSGTGGALGFVGHLAQTVLPDYLTNSAWLMFGVTFGVVLLGIPSAALVSLCEFPGRRLVSLLLLLPLACPAYILAYTYTGILDPAGMFAGIFPQPGWHRCVRYRAPF